MFLGIDIMWERPIRIHAQELVLPMCSQLLYYIRVTHDILSHYCRGNVVEPMDPNSTTPFLYPQPLSFVLSSTGPQLLIYFYTDMGTEADGFEIDYWYVFQSYSLYL